MTIRRAGLNRVLRPVFAAIPGQYRKHIDDPSSAWSLGAARECRRLGRPVFFLLGSLAENRGGMTGAIMARANAFVEMGHPVTLLTVGEQSSFGDGKDFESIISRLKKTGKLAQELEVRNFYTDVTGFSSEVPSGNRSPSPFMIFVHKVRRYLAKRLRRTTYQRDLKGRARVRAIASTGSTLREFFSPSGQSRLTLRVGRDGIVNEVRSNDVEYSTLEDAWLAWFQSQVLPNSIVMTDYRKLDHGLKRLAAPGLTTVSVLHSNHFRAPYRLGAEVRDDYRRLFENNSVSAIAVLTPEQKGDIAAQGFETANFHVLPNLYVRAAPSVSQKRELYLASLARYAEQKRLQDAIKIIRLVSKELPSVRYDLFGRGTERGKLKVLVEELGLTSNVFVNDYTKDPKKVLSESSCTLMTSRFEGLPLAIIESFAAGTPVISYDINYGPAFAIRDGESGFLVPEGDLESGARRVIEILTDAKLRERLSQGALEASKRFSIEQYKKSWSNVLSDRPILHEETEAI